MKGGPWWRTVLHVFGFMALGLVATAVVSGPPLGAAWLALTIFGPLAAIITVGATTILWIATLVHVARL